MQAQEAAQILEDGLKNLKENSEQWNRNGGIVEKLRMELVCAKAMTNGIGGMSGYLKAQDEVFLGQYGWTEQEFPSPRQQ